MVSIELGKNPIKGIIALYEADIFSTEEFKERLNTFEKKDFIEYVVLENSVPDGNKTDFDEGDI